MRQFAEKVGGHPHFLHAPALSEPDLYDTLTKDPSIARVFDMCRTARCAVVAVGPPPLRRGSSPDFLRIESASQRKAVGDVCSRFYDGDRRAVQFPGSDRMISTPLDEVRNIPVTIAVAAGPNEGSSVAVGARAGYFTELVTDVRHCTGIRRVHDA